MIKSKYNPKKEEGKTLSLNQTFAIIICKAQNINFKTKIKPHTYTRQKKGEGH
jgi:hypothetical protein